MAINAEKFQASIFVSRRCKSRLQVATQISPGRPISLSICLPRMFYPFAAGIDGKHSYPSVLVNFSSHRGLNFATSKTCPLGPTRSVRHFLPFVSNIPAPPINRKNFQLAALFADHRDFGKERATQAGPGRPITIGFLLPPMAQLTRIIHLKDLQPPIRIFSNRRPANLDAIFSI